MPRRGRASMSGLKRARASTRAVAAQRSRSAARANRAIWSYSAANDFTTRVPFTFSSTTMATSAIRPWVTHERGNTRSRNCWPSRNTSGMVDTVTRVRGTWMLSMNPRAIRKLATDSPARGPKASRSWMERMSELAREMTSPAATRS